MPRNPRLFISGKVYEISFRTEEGLPLVCTPYMKVILEGIIARAFSAYDCKLLSIVVMGNHMHLHLLVHNPEHVDDLVGYLKRESAHAINNLLSRRRRTIWLAGYDAVLILDAEKMIDRLCYVFLNPSRAGLETSVSLYPGINSWRSLLKDGYTLTGRRIPRDGIPPLPSGTMSFKAQEEFADSLLENALGEDCVQIDPLAFLGAFPGAAHLDREEIRARIIRRVTEGEAKLTRERSAPVIGAHALRLQSMRKPHEPEKFGKKMWVFGTTKEIRKGAIEWLKAQFSLRKELKEMLSLSEFLRNLPSGFFAPGGFLRANLNPALVPI